MNWSTRLSHSRWRSDMLKSIGRSSPDYLYGFPRFACRPQSGNQQALTFRDSQTTVSYSCLKCKLPVENLPMASDQTRTAILNAAERLYAERGFADVTLRDIVAAADVNLAAVNYHFGSKDELIAELFVTRSLALNRERLSDLRAAEDRGGGRA